MRNGATLGRSFPLKPRANQGRWCLCTPCISFPLTQPCKRAGTSVAYSAAKHSTQTGSFHCPQAHVPLSHPTPLQHALHIPKFFGALLVATPKTGHRSAFQKAVAPVVAAAWHRLWWAARALCHGTMCAPARAECEP